MLIRFSLISLTIGVLGTLPSASAAEPFSQKQNVNFYREVASRDISGMGLRSDGRLISGPILQELAGIPRGDLWWDLEPLDEARWLVATGPEGKVFQVGIDPSHSTYEATDWADTSSNHVFVLERLGPDLVAGGTHPDGSIVLWNRLGEERARVALPADSVLDLHWDESTDTLWVATGNPGALYAVTPDTVLATGPDDPLEDRGVKLVGTIRDRNLRSLAMTADGAVIGGSSPSGNIYRFDPEADAPIILFDQESGEVTDILVATNGDIYATLVMASGTTTRRFIQSANVQPQEESGEKKEEPEATSPAPSIFEAPPIDAFTGRSELIVIPGGDGIPRTLSSRNKMAMYRIIRYGELFLIGGGDDGELLGYDPVHHRALSFAGGNSAQTNDIEPLGPAGEFLLLTNNPSGLARLDFSATGPRAARTGSINLQTPSKIGALRFNRLRHISPEDIQVRMRANRGRDAVEGWTPWQTATVTDDLWQVDDLVGVNLQIELTLPNDLTTTAELDQAELFYLPLNRRPVLRSFRIVSPNFALIPRSNNSPASPNLTLGQVIGSSPNPTANSDDKNRQALLSSNVVPQPGAQVVTWTVSDPDGDQMSATFSIRKSASDAWIDLAVGPNQGWFQFDRRGLTEGTYFTRLAISEEAPRAASERQTVEFATDDLVIDLSPPQIDSIDLSVSANQLAVRVEASDSITPVIGLRLAFNNGYSMELGQPADGILDSRAEEFATEIDQRLIAIATAVEVYASDEAGNVAIRRVDLN